MFRWNLIVMVAVSLFALSCANGGSGQVSAPMLTPDNAGSINIANSSATHHLWGFWSVKLNPETLTAEIIPLRGLEFTCNVTRFMQPPASPVHMINIAILPSSDPATGRFDVDVTLKHPFPGLNLYRGFDVRGVFIANGSISTGHDPSAVYGGEPDARLLNADGLTRWWNPTEFISYDTIFGFTNGKLAPPIKPSATLNGYKYFADGLGYDQSAWQVNPASRGTFPTSPGVYTRPYHLQFPLVGGEPDLTFNYAVDASWDAPDPAGEPDYGIEYFPLTANCAEPYSVSVVDNGSTVFYEDPASNGGNLKLAIRIYDWQAPADPNGVHGEISALWLESPVLTSPVNALSGATILPDGPTSSVFEVNIGGLNVTHAGSESLLVFAEASDSFGYEPQVPGGSNFYFPSSPLGSYLLTQFDILSENPVPNAPLVSSINPDHGVSGEVLTGVEVGGKFFATGAQVELRKTGWPAIEATNEVTQPGGTKIICDIDLDLAAEGDWDVVVINPDLLEGVLPAGFHVSCADGLHTYEGKHYLTGSPVWNYYCQRGDLCILESGIHKGDCVVKRTYGLDAQFTGYYVRFDPDNPSDTPATDFFSVPGRTAVDPNSAYITMTASLDQNPVNSQIAVVNGRMFDAAQIVDENGTHLEDVVVSDPATPAGQVPTIGGLDFDKNGDMWLVTNVKGIVDETPPPIFQLRHYEVKPSSPYYVEKLSDRLDISEDLYDPNAQPYGHMWYIADIAISYAEDSLFVFSASISGWGHSYFAKYDLTTSPPTKTRNEDLVPSCVYCTNPYGISRADIDFDHSDLSVETCRLMVMYQTYDTTVRTHLMRLDTDMNVLNDQIVGPGFGAWDNPHAVAFNTDPDKRNLIGIDMDMSQPYNDFYYFTMPTSGW